jgi:hypothetical protein
MKKEIKIGFNVMFYSDRYGWQNGNVIDFDLFTKDPVIDSMAGVFCPAKKDVVIIKKLSLIKRLLFRFKRFLAKN